MREIEAPFYGLFHRLLGFVYHLYAFKTSNHVEYNATGCNSLLDLHILYGISTQKVFGRIQIRIYYMSCLSFYLFALVQ